MTTITEQELQERGYRRYTDTLKISHEHSDCFYQKLFSDHIGIRYHIEFYHYAGVTFPNGTEMPESWMVEMNQNEPHMTFQLHKPHGIGHAEAMVLRFWQSMGCDYYEMYA